MPLLTPYLSSLWIGLVTPVDAEVAKPLIEGAATETVVKDPSGMELFEVSPTPIDEAMRGGAGRGDDGRLGRGLAGRRTRARAAAEAGRRARASAGSPG